MTSPFRFLARVFTGAVLASLAVGGAVAAWDVTTRKHVMEFQGGPESTAGERLLGLAQRIAVEGVGFGVTGVALGALALVLALPRARRGAWVREAAATFVLVAAAFAAWVTGGAWFTNEMLPFLSGRELIVLNVAGFGVALAGFLVFAAIVRRLPRAPREEPAAVAFASLAAMGVAAAAALLLLRSRSGAWREPLYLAGVAACFLAALPAAVALARAAHLRVAALGERLSRGPLLPAPVRLGGLAIVALSVGATIPNFRLSAVPASVEYRSIPARGTPKGPNVVFITVDTLRADRLGMYGYSRGTSPFLDSFAAGGTVCEDVSAAAPWTKPSTATLLTGLYPSRHGALYHGSHLQLPPGEHALAETFREAGYVTAGFVSNPNVKKYFDFDRGFDEFFDAPVEDTVTIAALRNSYFGRVLTEITRYQFNWKNANDNAEMNRHLLAWLDKNARARFFLYLHYIDPHEPYEPPAPYRARMAQDHGFPTFNARKRLVASDLYDGEIAYVDDGIKSVVDRFRSLGILENTLFVLTSDHGEEFFEHGALGHGFALYQEVIRVPLFFRGPGVPAGKRIAAPLQNVDLAATLLDLAGTGVARLGDGHSYAPMIRSGEGKPPASIFLENEFGENDEDIRSFVMSAAREGSFKLILNERSAYRPPENPLYGFQELYDLSSDPGEQRNLIKHESERPRIQRLIDDLMRHSEFLVEKGLRTEKPPALSDEQRAQLEAVGYLKGKK